MIILAVLMAGVAALALQPLGHLLGERRYLDASTRCLRLFQAQLAQQPVAFPTLLAVLDEALVPPRVILLRGPADGLRPWSMALAPKLTARDLLLALPNGQKVPAALAKPEPDRPTAWIWQRHGVPGSADRVGYRAGIPVRCALSG